MIHAPICDDKYYKELSDYEDEASGSEGTCLDARRLEQKVKTTSHKR